MTPRCGVPAAPPVGTLAILREPALLALHALLVAVLLGTGLMGWWQLEVWLGEQADDVAERAVRSPVPLAEVLGPDEALANEDVGVPVVVEGRYASVGEQFLVTGRELDGRRGYWALSPLRVEGTGSSLLVVRGWTRDGSGLPPVPTGPVRETGVLQPGQEGSGAVSPERMVQAVRIPALVAAVDRDLYGAYLLRSAPGPADPASGLQPVPPPEPEASWSAGLRNLVYASQWWLFGAFGLFLWWRTCVDRVRTARDGVGMGRTVREPDVTVP